MFRAYKDCRGRCVCMADALTGEVEHKYKGDMVRTTIPVGSELTIERDGVRTVLRRVSANDIQVTSTEM